MGTCEQRDTGQGHPDKGTGQRMDDYLQIHGHFCWNGRFMVMVSIFRVDFSNICTNFGHFWADLRTQATFEKALIF